MSDFTNRRYYIVNPADLDPNTKKFGPYTLGDTPTVPGAGQTRVEDPAPGQPDNHFRPIVEDPRPSGRVTDTRLWDQVAQVVQISYTVDPPTPGEVAEAKRFELDQRWQQAVRGGIPYSTVLNGDTLHALLRYNEVDQYVWGTHDYGMPAPAGGLLVALHVPLVAPGKPYDGKTAFAIAGEARLDSAKLAIRDHVNTASLAWETGRDNVQAILESATDDATKVINIEALDVEIYAWPSNDVPAP